MDFARPHVILDTPASRSNIVAASNQSPPEKKELQEDDPKTCDLDSMALEAANQAALDLLLGPLEEGATKSDRRVDGKDFKESCLPPQRVIQEGDLVVIMINFDNLSFVYAKHKGIFSNRHGHFHHDDFIGKPFGCKIRSRNNKGFGFCYLLKPTPELWTRSLNHRTQIVHELDQSQIVHQLWLRPNLTVVESGTGSAALSHALLRTIAPHGHLHTYEFHPQRAEKARAELEQHTSPAMVTVHHKDVCGKAPTVSSSDERNLTVKGGFDLPGQSVDAVFLDLPEPWLAIPHAAFVLKPNARIATYSPCVEQSQRTIQAMRAAGFHSIQTMEYRLQEHYVDDVSYESPPRFKRRRLEKHVHKKGDEADEEADAEGDAEGDSEEDGEIDETAEEPAKSGGEKGNAKLTNDAKNGDKPNASANGKAGPTSRMLVARPFVMMRGHTAFLTFATASNVPQPDPNEPSDKQESDEIDAKIDK